MRFNHIYYRWNKKKNNHKKFLNVVIQRFVDSFNLSGKIGSSNYIELKRNHIINKKKNKILSSINEEDEKIIEPLKEFN